MSDRTPAGEKGTADRIEADDGYWVRLVSKQALKREGVCMGNCLDSQGHGQETAGEEEMVSNGFWSLRKTDGLSHMLVQVHAQRIEPFVGNAAGPKNNQPSAWCCRQLRHLVNAFLDAGSVLRVPDAIALTGEDGRTWRPDKAPQDLKDAAAARRKAEEEAKAKATSAYRESAWCNMELRNGAAVVLRGEPVRDGPINPSREARSIASAIQSGIISRAEVCEEFETGLMTERVILCLEGTSGRPPRQEDVLTPEDGGTFTFSQTGRDGSIHTVTGVLLLGSVQTMSEIGPSTLQLRMAKRHPPGMRAFGAEMRAGARSGIEVDMLGAPVAYHIPERWGETRHYPGIIIP